MIDEIWLAPSYLWCDEQPRNYLLASYCSCVTLSSAENSQGYHMELRYDKDVYLVELVSCRVLVNFCQ